jgi:hypothetical protein
LSFRSALLFVIPQRSEGICFFLLYRRHSERSSESP